MKNYVSDESEVLTWVQSDGGPLLLLEHSLLTSWHGSRSSDSQIANFNYAPDTKSDYMRACTVQDYLGLISVGLGTGLVLGDEPNMTTWWPLSNHDQVAGVLVRWVYADSPTSVIEALQQIPHDIWQPDNITFRIGADTLCLFDSAYPGKDVGKNDSLSISLLPGSYSLSTAQYRPNTRINLCLHGFMAA